MQLSSNCWVVCLHTGKSGTHTGRAINLPELVSGINMGCLIKVAVYSQHGSAPKTTFTFVTPTPHFFLTHSLVHMTSTPTQCHRVKVPDVQQCASTAELTTESDRGTARCDSFVPQASKELLPLRLEKSRKSYECPPQRWHTWVSGTNTDSQSNTRGLRAGKSFPKNFKNSSPKWFSAFILVKGSSIFKLLSIVSTPVSLYSRGVSL